MTLQKTLYQEVLLCWFEHAKEGSALLAQLLQDCGFSYDRHNREYVAERNGAFAKVHLLSEMMQICCNRPSFEYVGHPLGLVAGGAEAIDGEFNRYAIGPTISLESLARAPYDAGCSDIFGNILETLLRQSTNSYKGVAGTPNDAPADLYSSGR